MTATCHRHWLAHSAFQPEFQDSLSLSAIYLNLILKPYTKIFFTSLLTVLKRCPLSIMFYLLVRSPPEVRVLTLPLNNYLTTKQKYTNFKWAINWQISLYLCILTLKIVLKQFSQHLQIRMHKNCNSSTLKKQITKYILTARLLDICSS